MLHWDTEKAVSEYWSACNRNADEWVAANCGTEVPFVKNGTMYLYVWSPYTGEHGFLDMGTDIVMSDKEFYREA